MTSPGPITGVHTVGVPATDQDRMIDFYVGTLGFDQRPDALPRSGTELRRPFVRHRSPNHAA